MFNSISPPAIHVEFSIEIRSHSCYALKVLEYSLQNVRHVVTFDNFSFNSFEFCIRVWNIEFFKYGQRKIASCYVARSWRPYDSCVPAHHSFIKTFPYAFRCLGSARSFSILYKITSFKHQNVRFQKMGPKYCYLSAFLQQIYEFFNKSNASLKQRINVQFFGALNYVPFLRYCHFNRKFDPNSSKTYETDQRWKLPLIFILEFSFTGYGTIGPNAIFFPISKSGLQSKFLFVV